MICNGCTYCFKPTYLSIHPLCHRKRNENGDEKKVLPAFKSNQSKHHRQKSLIPTPAAPGLSSCLQIRKEQFKSITQRHHIRIRVALQLIPLRDDLDSPAIQLRILARLEAEVEIARVLAVDAEGVSGAAWIGYCIGCQPALWIGADGMSASCSWPFTYTFIYFEEKCSMKTCDLSKGFFRVLPASALLPSWNFS